MAELIAVNRQLYCGQCGEEASAEMDIGPDIVWIEPVSWWGPGYLPPPKPTGYQECLGCRPGMVAIRDGPNVYYELSWAWLAALEGL